MEHLFYVGHFPNLQNNWNMTRFPLSFLNIVERKKYTENFNMKYIKGLLGISLGIDGRDI